MISFQSYQMPKKNYKSGATFGAVWEETFDTWLRNADIKFKHEKTLTNSKQRKTDLKCDIKCTINSKDVFIELKTTTTKQAIGYSLY